MLILLFDFIKMLKVFKNYKNVWFLTLLRLSAVKGVKAGCKALTTAPRAFCPRSCKCLTVA